MNATKTSIPVAITLGQLLINAPVLIIGGVIPFLFWQSARQTGAITWLCLLLPVCIALAWLWWSFMVPKWRLWALQRVDSPPKLYAAAFFTGLLWPPGFFIEKTEIKSTQHKLVEQGAELLYYLSPYCDDATVAYNHNKGNPAAKLRDNISGGASTGVLLAAATALETGLRTGELRLTGWVESDKLQEQLNSYIDTLNTVPASSR